MRLAIVIVHYHTPELAVEAVATVTTDLERAGLSGSDVERLLVDNGSDAAERRILADLPVRRLDPGENLGYAAGVNLGMAATRAETIVLMNPDVLVLPGCLPALLAELERGAAVAGPRSFWDRGRQLILPPAEERTRRGELSALLAGRGEAWAARARRSWRRQARRHWEAERPLPSYDLPGFLLALRRSAWERVGPFDPGFRLFFEETDWLLRARRAGVPARYVPAARAIHLYNQSAGREPRAQAWFEESAERFRRRHYGAWFPPLLRAVAGALPPAAGGSLVPPEALPAGGLDLAALGLPFPLWVEVSPNPAGFPAAAAKVESADAEPWRLPAEIAAQFPAGGLVIQVSDRQGREVLRRSLPAAEGAS
ncbi:MAG TPA: glycosyltransferase family 2 protein [Thermoanaerobaculia bacterium]|nr:glycosyltransferase family 2 protein [Thermoanaerobaculia bacterium]